MLFDRHEEHKITLVLSGCTQMWTEETFNFPSSAEATPKNPESWCLPIHTFNNSQRNRKFMINRPTPKTF